MSQVFTALLFTLAGADAATAQVNNRPAHEVLVTVTQLNFGKVIADGRGGAVRIDPVTGERTSMGGVYLLGGKPARLELTITGTAESTVTVIVPQSIRLSGIKSAASVEWHPEYPAQNPSVVLDAQGNGRLMLGGTLVFPPGQRFDAEMLTAIYHAQTLSLQPPTLRAN